jgi:hypothetical protein
MIKAITNNQITNHKLKIEEARGWRIEDRGNNQF